MNRDIDTGFDLIRCLVYLEILTKAQGGRAMLVLSDKVKGKM